MKFKKSIITIAVVVTSFNAGLSCSAMNVDDGFSNSRSFKTRYFTVSVEPGVDMAGLTTALSVPPSIKAMIREPISQFDPFTFSNQVDLLFLAVSAIMDMHLTRFSCHIKICKDSASLKKIGKKLYGRKIPRAPAFYVPEIDTMYVNSEDINISIFAHELSHAIQCQYFVVTPPMKIQEVLAGFVEYQLRKYTGTLPRR